METNNIHIKYCKSGIIKVIVNTKTRWCDYSLWRDYDGRFVFEERDEGGYTNKIYSFSIDFVEGVKYNRITNTEKDQVYIYFIPYGLLDIGE